MATVTHTITLIPSGTTGSTNMTVSSSYPIDNGYTNADDTSYARFSISTSSTGYIYYTFDTSEIPDNATITSVSARGRAYVGNTTRVTNTVMQFYANTTAKGSNTTFASTTGSVRTLSPGSWTRTELNNLRLRIGGTGSSSSSSKYVYFGGADITITYTIQAYTISASGDGTLDPSTSQTIDSGGSYSLSISGLSSKPTVTDNNVDVTSQLVEVQEQTDIVVPSSSTVSTFTTSTISNAYTGADSDTYANLNLAGRQTGTVYLELSGISIPSGATIKSLSCQATLQSVTGSSSSAFTSSCQMYAGTTAKGSSTSWAPSRTAIPKTTFNMTMGTWTASELANARFYLTATNSASSTQRQVYIYGVTLSVTYESDGITYIYTISNVSADHTIVVSASASTSIIYYKNGSTWTAASKVYKKVNGSWVQQNNLSSVFSSGINYVYG